MTLPFTVDVTNNCKLKIGPIKKAGGEAIITSFLLFIVKKNIKLLYNMVNAEISKNQNANQTGPIPVIDIEETKRTRSGSISIPKAKVLRPFNTNEVKILLLENINETAVKAFVKQGYQVNSDTT